MVRRASLAMIPGRPDAQALGGMRRHAAGARGPLNEHPASASATTEAFAAPSAYHPAMTDPTAPGPLAATAALLADPARARMLAALLCGEALTAGELARIAGVTPATTSGHLARLAEGGLVLVHAQGRHRYHRLASEEVAAAIEALGGLAARLAPARPWKHGEAARQARLCWNHLAGRLGVALHARLTGQGWLRPGAGGWDATEEGRARLVATGVDVTAAGARRGTCACIARGLHGLVRTPPAPRRRAGARDRHRLDGARLAAPARRAGRGRHPRAPAAGTHAGRGAGAVGGAGR